MIRLLVKSAFQCSSASRKFLTFYSTRPTRATCSFSALQRAENSSTHFSTISCCNKLLVSVLFSEPKIPHALELTDEGVIIRVSVLFSEPKIPQHSIRRRAWRTARSFSALQRAENSSLVLSSGSHRFLKFQCSSASRKFLIRSPRRGASRSDGFQCSSASRKFLNHQSALDDPRWATIVSVLFSEPKIPHSANFPRNWGLTNCFSALQRAENSST